MRFEHRLVSTKRQRGTVDRRKRRTQLVGDRRDELGLEPLDALFAREIAERVHRSAVERDT